MFDKDAYLKDMNKKYCLDYLIVKQFLTFSLGEDYKVSLPSNLAEVKDNVKLEDNFGLMKAQIDCKSYNDTIIIQLSIYQNYQESERLAGVLNLFIMDNTRYYSPIIRLNIVDYLEDGSTIYSNISSKYDNFTMNLEAVSQYYNCSTCQFIGQEIKDIDTFYQLEKYNIYPDEYISYDTNYGCLRNEWMQNILNEHTIRKQELIDKVNSNAKLILESEK